MGECLFVMNNSDSCLYVCLVLIVEFPYVSVCDDD